MKIIIDAMGGDNAPLEIVKGALLGMEHWGVEVLLTCLLYTSPSPRDGLLSRMPSSA